LRMTGVFTQPVRVRNTMDVEEDFAMPVPLMFIVVP
jgi:hypothetical protein